jgi:ATP dependent DNA ligase domain
MLARSGRLPTSGGYSFEVKWDGFRAIPSTEGPLRVRSRRGWDMTPHVGFLAQLPVAAVLDGELVALDDDGKPEFPQLCECVLMRRTTAPLTFIVFDVLSVDGRNVMGLPYIERRDPRRPEPERSPLADAGVVRRRRGVVGGRVRARVGKSAEGDVRESSQPPPTRVACAHRTPPRRDDHSSRRMR